VTSPLCKVRTSPAHRRDRDVGSSEHETDIPCGKTPRWLRTTGLVLRAAQKVTRSCGADCYHGHKASMQILTFRSNIGSTATATRVATVTRAEVSAGRRLTAAGSERGIAKKEEPRHRPLISFGSFVWFTFSCWKIFAHESANRIASLAGSLTMPRRGRYHRYRTQVVLVVRPQDR